MAVETSRPPSEKEQYLQHLVQILLAWRKSLCAIDRKTMADLVGHDLVPKLFGRLLVMVVENATHAGLLNEIHSETTVNERRFLYNFFAHVWSGRRNVLEIGPFLGGTTRAIAMGMSLNPNLDLQCRLHTFDKFSEYYKGEQFDNLLKQLIGNGQVGAEMRGILNNSTSFRELFLALHKAHEYFTLVEMNERALPETPQELSSLENLFTLDGGLEYDAVFVDGCKGWYSTKHFMREAAKVTRPGAYFIFQDYGWYTCFWISTFLAVMGEYFTLVASVDNTYTFQLVKPLDVKELEGVFPDSPQVLGESFFNSLFNQLIEQAAVKDDSYAQFVHNLHHAAALAYLGNREGARAKLTELASRPYPPGYRNLIQCSLKSPTYTPEGPIYL